MPLNSSEWAAVAACASALVALITFFGNLYTTNVQSTGQLRMTLLNLAEKCNKAVDEHGVLREDFSSKIQLISLCVVANQLIELESFCQLNRKENRYFFWLMLHTSIRVEIKKNSPPNHFDEHTKIILAKQYQDNFVNFGKFD